MVGFLQGVERISVTLEPRPNFNFDRTKRWLRKTVAPTLATYISVMGMGELYHLLQEGKYLAEKSKRLKAELVRARKSSWFDFRLKFEQPYLIPPEKSRFKNALLL